MSLIRAQIASTGIALNPADHIAAYSRQQPAEALFTDNDHRRRMRSLLDGAALAGAQVRVAFFTKDDSLRYMLCEPCIGQDDTARYYTVVDVEASAANERSFHRRVDLDTIIGATIEYRASAGH